MSEIVAAKLDESNRVIDLIVSSAEWAAQTYGGTWIQFDRDEVGENYPAHDDLWDPKKKVFVKNSSVADQVSQTESVKAKLAALGLTDEEIKALIG
jgi:hypothetical protein